MRFIIRADAYSKSGAGHVMRSSVIAEELINRGYEVFFVGNLDEIPWVREYIWNLGFKGILTPGEHFVTNQVSDTLILDSYEISIADPFIQPSNWKKILVLVDDTTPSYIGHIYIHPGPATSWTIPKTVSSGIFLVGLEYLLIRKSLRKLKNDYTSTSNQEMNILISSGGSDPYGFAKSLVEILSKSNSRFHAFVLAPDFAPPDDDARFEIIPMGKEYERLLRSLDFVFTTAGTSSWEYHYLGLPVALASAIQNQNRNYQYQIAQGMSWNLGYRDFDGSWHFDESLLKSVLSGTQQLISDVKISASELSEVGVNSILKFIV